MIGLSAHIKTPGETIDRLHERIAAAPIKFKGGFDRAELGSIIKSIECMNAR